MPLAEPFRLDMADDVENTETGEYEQQDSRPKSSKDPLEVKDPWKNYESVGDHTPPARKQFAGAVTHPGAGTYEGNNPRKMMHDAPPEWDGLDPQKNLEPYLKLLQGWLITTATLPQQRGLIIMNYAKGDLRRLLDNLDIEELTHQDSGQRTFDFVKGEYSEYIVSKKPLRVEEAFYDPERCRKKGEGFISYISRRKDRFNKLQKEGWKIPEDVKGYLLYRDAHLSDKCRDLIDLWTGGEYDWTDMQTQLKKLERPVPGAHGGDHARIRMIGFQEDIAEVDARNARGNIYYGGHSDAAEEPIYMRNSLFLLPEAFDTDELLHAAIEDVEDTDAIWLPDDFPEEGGIPEDIFITVLANYGQVRKFLHTKALGRGFRRPQPPRTGGSKFAPKAITDRNHRTPGPPAAGQNRRPNT